MSRHPSRPALPNGLWHVFRWPTLLAATSLAGLLSALIGDGWADVLSWFLLGSLIVVIAVAWKRASAVR
jgi:uncharacterized membrane protein YjjP (DUF1212 family)